MNLPNKLTVSRFVLTAFFLAALFCPSQIRFHNTFHDTIALFLFAIASFTDFLDGKIARARGLITNFGILMDPLADKILTCSAFIAFVESSHLHPDAPVKVGAWMVVIIVARELAITGLRLLAASKNVVLAAENFGKHKTISQIVAILSFLVVAASPEWPPALQNLLHGWAPQFTLVMLWVTVTLTASSGVLYLWRNRQIYLSDV